MLIFQGVTGMILQVGFRCSTMMTEHPTGHDDGLDIHRL